MPTLSLAEDTLPESVRAQVHIPLKEVGSGTYRRFGLRVYRAILWAPEGKWDTAEPYALQLCYTRSVSKETLVDTVTDDIRGQNVTDDATLAAWQSTLNATLPEVEDGDTIIGLSMPKKPATIYYNGTKIASIEDQTFSRAFFDIWLGKTADEDMREGLLGNDK